MASRSHVDVNERRLRPIYDCLDNGNNKKAIQEADKVLKKQKDLSCAKVLKALALLRMGRMSEGNSLLAEVHKSEPMEEQTLNAMSICYKETHQYSRIASLYEAAARQQPANEDILSCLFMAHVRLGNYRDQQRTAMALHKCRPNKNPYYFWAVMSIVMQAHSDEKLGRVMYLPLAEKMTNKYIQEEKIEAEAEILLYLIILELQEKWEECLTVLDGPLGAQLGNELNLRETKLAHVCIKLGKWDRVNSIYKQLLNHTPDDWAFWLAYLDSGFHMVDEGFVCNGEEEAEANKSAKDADSSAELMWAYICEKISAMENGVQMRGPYLARIEFLRRLLARKFELAETVGSALQHLQGYFDLFGHKSCCHGDMTLFIDMLSESQKDEFLNHMKEGVDLDNTSGVLQYPKDVNQLTRHLVCLQMARTMGKHRLFALEETLTLSQDLLLLYREGLTFGKELLPTDLQYSDNYLLLATHLLLDAWEKTGDDIHLWQAIVYLELGIRESTSNFQFKLLLIRLYCFKGVFGPCPALYDGMEIKHIMNDTLGYIASNHVIRLGHFMEAGTMYATMVRFFVVNQKEASEHLMSSYKFGSFGRIQEFVKFQDRLDNSIQYHSAATEKMLLDLIMQTDRHDSAEAALDFMNVHPLTDQPFDVSKICDNRDLTIALCWDPPNILNPEETRQQSREEEVAFDVFKICDNRDLTIALCWDPPNILNPEETRQQSREEEEAWLLLRWRQLHILLLALMVGRDMGAGTTDNNLLNGEGETSKEVEKPVDVLRRRVDELREHASQCAETFLEPRKCHVVQGPFRTRISGVLSGPHLGLLASMVDCVYYVHDLHSAGLGKVDESKEKLWKTMKESAGELRMDGVQGLLRDINGKRQLDSSTLENLVASVETISYLTILAGVCNRGLKSLKEKWQKKNKKNKGPSISQHPAFEGFNQLVTELSSITKELHQAAAGLDPVFSSIDIASLRLADIPEEEELQREAERLVWSKVERSVQQSSREVCEVLHHKQFYLNTLLL
ncbi:N-alpha-acetyltransferase 25, natb auxiliary subunit-like [Plakobranchus ocellatus]|uniref:N-alpha-acetyltransferase 25, natb auxiliary subunit-like n=1 Tax=Plakobranchus ocellatus TaxID=259542 RepID=A0AAV4APW7_9GAST|nr:N-alpha-acetyltransferase 25, natb auxiliary subunit-like [Plakobranchus ocellatus]